MKISYCLTLVTIIFIAGCVSTTPPKNKSRNTTSQHERAQSAFDELDGKSTSSSTNDSVSNGSHKTDTDKPVYTNPSKAKPAEISPDEPEPEEDFTSSKYLTAKGYGMSEPEAVRQAKAELSNIFEARISSDVTSKVNQVTDSMKGASYNKSIQTKIRIKSDINLEGVRVGKVWKENGEYVTIAAMDKYKARDKWANDISKIDSKTDVLLKKSNSAQSKILKLMPLKKTLDLWVEREIAISRLRVLGFASEVPQKDLKPILLRISDIKSSMLVKLDISGEHAQSVMDTIAETLTDNGFIIEDSRADVLIKGTIKINKVKNNNPRFKFSRATVSLNILDTLTGNQVGQVNENQRGAGLNYDESAHHSVKKVSKKVSKKLVHYFN